MFGDKRRTITRGGVWARTVVVVVAAALAATTLTAAPAQAGLTTVFYSGQSTAGFLINPLDPTLGGTTVTATWKWTNGVSPSGWSYCQIDATMDINTSGTNSYVDSNLAAYINYEMLRGPSFPAGKNIWSNTSLSPTHWQSKLNTQNFNTACTNAWGKGFAPSSSSPFFGTATGGVVLGAMSNLAFNVGFIGTMLVTGMYLAHFHPDWLVKDHVQSAVSALAGATGTFVSTLISSRLNWGTASAAGVISACITYFTEIPYLSAWAEIVQQAYQAQAEAGAAGQNLETTTSAAWAANAAYNAGGNIWAWIADEQGNVHLGPLATLLAAFGWSNWSPYRNQVIQQTAVELNNVVAHQINPGSGCV